MYNSGREGPSELLQSELLVAKDSADGGDHPVERKYVQDSIGAGKVVYLNPDVSAVPDFTDGSVEVYHESWAEPPEVYPEGAFTTWNPSTRPEFGMTDEAAEAVVSMLDGKRVATDGGIPAAGPDKTGKAEDQEYMG